MSHQPELSHRPQISHQPQKSHQLQVVANITEGNLKCQAN